MRLWYLQFPLIKKHKIGCLISRIICFIIIHILLAISIRKRYDGISIRPNIPRKTKTYDSFSSKKSSEKVRGNRHKICAVFLESKLLAYNCFNLFRCAHITYPPHKPSACTASQQHLSCLCRKAFSLWAIRTALRSYHPLMQRVAFGKAEYGWTAIWAKSCIPKKHPPFQRVLPDYLPYRTSSASFAILCLRK